MSSSHDPDDATYWRAQSIILKRQLLDQNQKILELQKQIQDQENNSPIPPDLNTLLNGLYLSISNEMPFEARLNYNGDKLLDYMNCLAQDFQRPVVVTTEQLNSLRIAWNHSCGLIQFKDITIITDRIAITLKAIDYQLERADNSLIHLRTLEMLIYELFYNWKIKLLNESDFPTLKKYLKTVPINLKPRILKKSAQIVHNIAARVSFKLDRAVTIENQIVEPEKLSVDLKEVGVQSEEVIAEVTSYREESLKDIRLRQYSEALQELASRLE
ncbi:hypothetical protein HK103_002633 [Boothiomyces macroporosus]|uniref:Uncharacterized protein n=1 Tax=Boothiomyces macroporosus TaxID=261099 RepID=A0AAD5UQ07_9FUNG|nr:hypothetical protein HK103_002633 [Boothiomyces macroporosus]